MLKIKLKFKLLLLLSFFVVGIVCAQESINTTGGNSSGSGGTISLSIGQLFYNEIGDSNIKFAYGVQHAYEIYLVNTETNFNEQSFSLSPNPTNNYLILTIDNQDIRNLYYQVFDVYGRILNECKIELKENIIDLSYLPMANYYIRIIQNNKFVKSFRIIKI